MVVILSRGGDLPRRAPATYYTSIGPGSALRRYDVIDGLTLQSETRRSSHPHRPSAEPLVFPLASCLGGSHVDHEQGGLRSRLLDEDLRNFQHAGLPRHLLVGTQRRHHQHQEGTAPPARHLTCVDGSLACAVLDVLCRSSSFPSRYCPSTSNIRISSHSCASSTW